MFKNALSILAVLVFSMSAFAKGGTVVGDGGHSVICSFEDGATTIELFDVVQARDRFQFGVFDTAIFWDTDQSIEMILRNLATLDLGHAQEALRESVTRAQAMSGLVTEYETLPYTQDVITYDRLPAGCELKQLGITREGPDRIGVSVLKSDWQRLDDPHKAVFLLHEALHFQIRDPEAVRQIIGYVIAPVFFQMQNRAVVEKIFATGQSVMWDEFVH